MAFFVGIDVISESNDIGQSAAERLQRCTPEDLSVNADRSDPGTISRKLAIVRCIVSRFQKLVGHVDVSL